MQFQTGFDPHDKRPTLTPGCEQVLSWWDDGYDIILKKDGCLYDYQGCRSLSRRMRTSTNLNHDPGEPIRTKTDIFSLDSNEPLVKQCCTKKGSRAPAPNPYVAGCGNMPTAETDRQAKDNPNDWEQALDHDQTLADDA